MINCYLICGTPRTGSTLLCQYLTSTGVAGKPESYFRKEDLDAYAEYWQIVRPDGTYTFADYLSATRMAGRTENGLLAIRIMGGTLEEMTAELGQLYPHLANDDLGLLEEAFGHLKFIYLRRKDVLAQAISLYRAEYTDYWHSIEGEAPAEQPTYDFDKIKARVDMLHAHNAAWQNWFRAVGVEPLTVQYEELSADPVGMTERVLQFIGVELPNDARLEAPNQRLADETTRLWMDRFTEELEGRTT